VEELFEKSHFLNFWSENFYFWPTLTFPPSWHFWSKFQRKNPKSKICLLSFYLQSFLSITSWIVLESFWAALNLVIRYVSFERLMLKFVTKYLFCFAHQSNLTRGFCIPQWLSWQHCWLENPKVPGSKQQFFLDSVIDSVGGSGDEWNMGQNETVVLFLSETYFKTCFTKK
jgi:hypothetical protein